MELIKCYTDGSATVAGENKGKGGFGVYFPDLLGSPRAFSLGFKNGLTGQMEVCALLYAIRAIPLNFGKPLTLRVFSDSEYVVKTFTEKRLQKWVANGWRNTSGEVKNRELWEHIIEALKDRSFMVLEMNHIRSHQVEKEKNIFARKLLKENPDIIGNMMADKFADYKRHTNLLDSVFDIKHRKSIF